MSQIQAAHSNHCAICEVKFTVPHYVWYNCLHCHYLDPNIDATESFEYRLKHKIELQD